MQKKGDTLLGHLMSIIWKELTLLFLLQRKRKVLQYYRSEAISWKYWFACVHFHCYEHNSNYFEEITEISWHSEFWIICKTTKLYCIVEWLFHISIYYLVCPVFVYVYHFMYRLLRWLEILLFNIFKTWCF